MNARAKLKVIPVSKGFPCGSVVKNPPAKQKWDQSLSQGLLPGEGNGNPLQYS